MKWIKEYTLGVLLGVLLMAPIAYLNHKNQLSLDETSSSMETISKNAKDIQDKLDEIEVLILQHIENNS